MRFVLLVLCSCAAALPPPSAPVEYTCSDHILTNYGEYLADEPGSLRLTAREDDRDVFASSTRERTIVIPHDRRSDAIEDFEVPHPTLERAASGAWTEATGLEDSDAPRAFTTAGVAALADSADVLSIILDLTQPATAQPVPLWPAHGTALVTDGTKLLPVIQVGERVSAPLPPQ